MITLTFSLFSLSPHICSFIEMYYTFWGETVQTIVECLEFRPQGFRGGSGELPDHKKQTLYNIPLKLLKVESSVVLIILENLKILSQKYSNVLNRYTRLIINIEEPLGASDSLLSANTENRSQTLCRQQNTEGFIHPAVSSFKPSLKTLASIFGTPINRYIYIGLDFHCLARFAEDET